MTLNLLNTCKEFLQQNPEQRFNAREIASWILENYPDKCNLKRSRSKRTVKPLKTNVDLLQQIIAEIGSQRPRLQKKYPEIKTIEGRPRKYYFTTSTGRDEIENLEGNVILPSMIGNNIINEYELYPILSQFLRSELKVYSKRINEKKSRNSQGAGGNKWLYPDVVGLQNLSQDWHREIKDCVRQYADIQTSLWSFEVKILINRTNVREAFFQTVSNSSWANFGYLVASEIESVGTLDELRILSNLHGIGVIRLDIENPSESQIIIPAKERNKVDWNIANRLTEENADFLDYIKLIRQLYQTGELKQSDWSYLIS